MKRIYLIICLFLVGFIVFIQANKDIIVYNYEVAKLNKEFSKATVNDYTRENSFSYLQENNNLKITSYKDIENSIYTMLNNGMLEQKRYCDYDYINCNADIDNIANNSNLLSNINNFVHPFNSFKEIVFTTDGDMKLGISITKIYDDTKSNTINDKVDEILSKIITAEMEDKKKVTVIHDYLIKNTQYDKLKVDNLNDNTYDSQTAYGVLIEGYGICSGYADTLAIFLDKLNIKNYKINNTEHVWNLVYINDEWKHVDITWDLNKNKNNTVIRNNYLLLSTSELEALNDNSHTYNKDVFIEAH